MTCVSTFHRAQPALTPENSLTGRVVAAGPLWPSCGITATLTDLDVSPVGAVLTVVSQDFSDGLVLNNPTVSDAAFEFTINLFLFSLKLFCVLVDTSTDQ